MTLFLVLHNCLLTADRELMTGLSKDTTKSKLLLGYFSIAVKRCHN